MSSSLAPWICRSCSRASRRISRVNRRPNLFQPRRSYSIKPHPQDGAPFRLAVIGSGPAGFYTAYKVMSSIENSVIDMYEHLPVPFGLVRFGVAPDHPEVKVDLPWYMTSDWLTQEVELSREIHRSCKLSTFQLHRQYRDRRA